MVTYLLILIGTTGYKSVSLFQFKSMQGISLNPTEIIGRIGFFSRSCVFQIGVAKQKYLHSPFNIFFYLAKISKCLFMILSFSCNLSCLNTLKK